MNSKKWFLLGALSLGITTTVFSSTDEDFSLSPKEEARFKRELNFSLNGPDIKSKALSLDVRFISLTKELLEHEIKPALRLVAQILNQDQIHPLVTLSQFFNFHLLRDPSTNRINHFLMRSENLAESRTIRQLPEVFSSMRQVNALIEKHVELKNGFVSEGLFAPGDFARTSFHVFRDGRFYPRPVVSGDWDKSLVLIDGSMVSVIQTSSQTLADGNLSEGTSRFLTLNDVSDVLRLSRGFIGYLEFLSSIHCMRALSSNDF